MKRNGLCQVSNLCLLDLRGWDVLTEPGAVSLIPRHWNDSSYSNDSNAVVTVVIVVKIVTVTK